MSLKEELTVKMNLLGIKPKRSLGQNFLISEHVVEQIFAHIALRQPKYIIEIGPGLGTLTEKLIEQNIPHSLIEYDAKFANYWRMRGETVIEIDAVKYDWKSKLSEEKILVLGNLPYQIGSRLVIELSLSAPQVDVLLFMFQKEVAMRLAAKQNDKDYGFLTVIAQSFWSIDKVVDAGPEAFYPSPNVSSRVLAFKRRKTDPRLTNDYIFFVKKAFQFRRKYMFKAFQDKSSHIKLSLKALGYKETVRAEELSIEDFQNLYYRSIDTL